jgi:bifunctional non-homologous end joining protein LigD
MKTLETTLFSFAYGRRGTTLRAGVKTKEPMGLEDCSEIFEDLVRAKLAEGYLPGEAAADYVPPDSTATEDGLPMVQLLNPIEEADLERYLLDERWIAQEKKDGKRMTLCRQGAEVFARQRQGKPCGFPKLFVQLFPVLLGDFVFDGEMVGETFYTWDALLLGGIDLTRKPYLERFRFTELLVQTIGSHNLCIVPIAETVADKLALVQRLQAEGREGVVFKKKHAAHTPGKAHSDQFKLCFLATLTARVIPRAGKDADKRSVGLELHDDVRWQFIGNVSVPANQEVPPFGSLVDVRYKYAFPESNKLFQPVLLGIRDDLDETAAAMNQLKYKSEE